MSRSDLEVDTLSTDEINALVAETAVRRQGTFKGGPARQRERQYLVQVTLALRMLARYHREALARETVEEPIGVKQHDAEGAVAPYTGLTLEDM